MEQHDAEWAAAPYAYSASEGAICHGTMSLKPADSLQPPGGNPPRLTVSPNQADRLAEAGNIGGDAAFSVLGYKLWIWITPSSGEASSGLITGHCKLSQPMPMIFTACMETLQSLSNLVILQCILNPVLLGCLLALGPKGIPCRCRGLRGNHSLLLIRHVFAHCRGFEKRLSQRS
jgi:hypothetical protein